MRIDLRLQMSQLCLLCQQLLFIIDLHLVLQRFRHPVKGYVHISKLILPLLLNPHPQIPCFHPFYGFHQNFNRVADNNMERIDIDCHHQHYHQQTDKENIPVNLQIPVYRLIGNIGK